MSGYENYTLSPVPWIKQMPEHWGLVRGKICIRRCNAQPVIQMKSLPVFVTAL